VSRTDNARSANEEEGIVKKLVKIAKKFLINSKGRVTSPNAICGVRG